MVEAAWRDPAGRTRKATALLEDICTSGACVQLDTPVPPGRRMRLRCGGKTLAGTVRYCVFREIGYFVGVEFARDRKWSRADFEPQHLLDLSKMVEPKRPD
ncbi:MAG: hypothetical protein ACE15B_15995 [Bryobacteraceae bacterium]